MSRRVLANRPGALALTVLAMVAWSGGVFSNTPAQSAMPTRSGPDHHRVPVRVGHAEHPPLLINPFHGVTPIGEGGGDGGGIVHVDAQADVAGCVAAPELYARVTEPDHARTVAIRTAAEERVEGKRGLGIGDEQGHFGEHNGF